MTFWRAFSLSTLRVGVIGMVCWLLQFPAAWLRPRFYPNGLNGNVLLIVLLVVLMMAVAAMFLWAATPLRSYWEGIEKKYRQESSVDKN